MRGNVPQYEIREPKNFQEILRMLKKEPNVWKLFAGGTDLMVLYESGKLEPRKFINIWNIRELKGIREEKVFLDIKALTTHSQVRENVIVQKEFPMLAEAAGLTGCVAIQNRGTLGGNIVNASPAADSPPALLAYEAEVELVSAEGERWIPYSDFHLGYKKMAMRSDELLRTIRLPRKTSGCRHYYRKVGTRKMQAISKVCFAGLISLNEDQIQKVRIGLGSVAPIPLRCRKTESILEGKKLSSSIIAQARKTFEQEISPIDDIRSTTEYRRHVAGNLLETFLG